MTTTTSYLYDLLGVANDAGDAEIERAYHRQLVAMHPDRACDETDRETRDRHCRLLADARHTLIDPAKRAVYDAQTTVNGGAPDTTSSGATPPQPARDPAADGWRQEPSGGAAYRASSAAPRPSWQQRRTWALLSAALAAAQILTRVLANAAGVGDASIDPTRDPLAFAYGVSGYLSGIPGLAFTTVALAALAGALLVGVRPERRRKHVAVLSLLGATFAELIMVLAGFAVYTLAVLVLVALGFAALYVFLRYVLPFLLLMLIVDR